MDFQIRKYIKVYIWAVAIATVAYFGLNFLRDVFGGEEAKVRKFIMHGKSAVERKNILGLSDMISYNYGDKYGNNSSSVIYGAKAFISYYKDILINIEAMDIRLNEAKTEADVEVTALIIGRTKEGGSDTIMSGLEGEKDKFRLKLVKEENGWKVVEIEFLQPLNVMGERIG